MTTSAKQFDAIAFKNTTQKQWDSAAEAWDRWGGLLSRWLGPSTDLMFDLCGLQTGHRVLDVAAGAGEQSVAAAKRVGTNGYLLATDLSSGILQHAAKNANLAGLENFETKAIDGEKLDDFECEAFDVAISRVGLIYFPDQQAALRGIYNKLKPGGKFGAIVYATADKNQFFSIPVSIIRRRAKLPAPLAGQPGPFSLGDPEVLAETIAKAGFNDIKIERVDAPVRLSSAEECLLFEQESFGALHQMMSGLTTTEQDAAWLEIKEALQEFEENGQFCGPCQLLVASATK